MSSSAKPTPSPQFQSTSKTYQPAPTVRYHKNISPDVVERAIDLNRMGSGQPAFHHQELLEKWCYTRGWSEADAKRVQLGNWPPEVVPR